jgi:methionyl-tRNA synthetase
MARRFYVTTPIYYVNGVPHLGTAYTTIVADALRRYHLLCGDDTRMLTGTDEHGLKIEREAVAKGISPQVFVDDMSGRFRAAWPELSIEPSDFIRTTEPRHTALVQELWRRVEANGDLYLGEYEDWYCVGCESFKTEKELLPGNLCPLHARPVERLKEKTYFFRLAKYQEPLLRHYEEHPEFIAPEGRRNEVLSFVRGELRDLSVSRTSFTWGIPAPGNPKHVLYVWFDALANYWTALGGEGAPLGCYWPPEGYALHLVGKDILRFHTVYWPAFLLSAKIPLPSRVFAHGFLTIDGQKMSKSLRNAVDPLRLARELGADVLRYQLLRAIAFGQDGDFDHSALLARYNADLGKNVGNLLSRTLGLCGKVTGGKTPAFGAPTQLETDFIEEYTRRVGASRAHWEALEPHRALEEAIGLSSAANQYIDRAAPWAAAKADSPERVGTILATLLEALRGLSVLLWPALPNKMAQMRVQLGITPLAPAVGVDLWPMRFEPRAAGEALAASGPLFPTFDKDAEQALLAKLAPRVDSEKPNVPVVQAAPGTVSYEQFAALDLRVGVVKTCERVVRKDKLLKLTVDLGEPEPRSIVAGLALTFAPEDLLGKRVLVVANLASREFGKGLVSHGMILATGPSEALRLASVPDDVPVGSRLK